MDLLDLLFPKKCVGCRGTGRYFCTDCATGARRSFFICPMCKEASFGGMVHEDCKVELGMDGLYAVWKYVGVVREAVKQYKFKFVRGLSEDLTKEATILILSDSRSEVFVDFLESQPIFTGIPLLGMRERWRGFNQAEMLAEKLAREFRGEFLPGVLKRTRLAFQQVELKKDGQEMNKKYVFRTSPSLTLGLHGTKVVLVDDVWTTGETMKEAAKVLKEAGVAEVWGLVIARESTKS